MPIRGANERKFDGKVFHFALSVWEPGSTAEKVKKRHLSPALFEKNYVRITREKYQWAVWTRKK